MADEKFKLPRSSYEELCKIIKAYGKVTKPSSNEDIDKLTGIGKTHISANNSFLLSIGIIEGGIGKIATSKGKELSLALEHEIPEEMIKAWRIIVGDNEFLSKMIQAIEVRKGMEESHLENHIAYSAGEVKSKEVTRGARTVIDILRGSGLVKQEGDQILPNYSTKLNIDETPIINDFSIAQDRNIIQSSINTSTIKQPIEERGFSLHIEVRINVSAEELEGLGEKLKQLIETIA